ncbi:DUF2213 domain-containing protein [Acinetobacter phage Brutus]|nr:DUF2213 domain-containing protein [Acinetobacter phage Brutus]
MKKVLCKFGVYPYLGANIPNWNNLGLDPDRVYAVLKNGNFIKQLHESMYGKEIPVYIGSPFHDRPEKFISESSYIDGIMFVNFDTNFELSAGYEVEAIKESGEYIGVHYDIVMKNPILRNITIVDRKLESLIA